MLVVERADDDTRHYVLRAADGALQLSEQDEPDADARVEGPEAAWIRALGPGRDRGELRFSGDRDVADALLDAITPADALAAAGRATIS